MTKRPLAWMLLPLLAYPLYAGVLLAWDAVRGDRLLGFYLRYDRRLFLDTLVSDYLSATPVLVAVFAALVVAYAALRRVLPGRSPRLLKAMLAAAAVLTLAGAVALRRPHPLALSPDDRATDEHFFVVGGGPTPRASQAQIEFNVAWVLATLAELAPEAVVRVHYANGADPGPGTVEHLPEPEGEARRFEALARVFGYEEDNRLRYRPHAILQAQGSTAAAELVPALAGWFEALTPGDQAFFLFNGHGTWEPDGADNALRLWGETRLSARAFEALLARVEPTVPVRVFFAQCFAGAFERVVHPGAREVLELSEANRCGFFAESEDRESEGCSASIDVGDYRDYTTWFFAALSGRTRLGEPVETRRDWDGDGVVTPFDAHLFTLVNGRNGDLPRTTSEVYLERWMPWSLRWVGTAGLPENLYGEAARQMALDAGLPADDPALGPALRRRFDAVVAATGVLQEEMDALQRRELELQGILREGLALRWPELDSPFTGAHQATVAGELDAISRHLLATREYPDLEAVQARRQEVELLLVERDRELSHLEKLLRTRMLARALDRLEAFAAPGHREAYARLRRCEALPLDVN